MFSGDVRLEQQPSIHPRPEQTVETEARLGLPSLRLSVDSDLWQSDVHGFRMVHPEYMHGGVTNTWKSGVGLICGVLAIECMAGV